MHNITLGSSVATQASGRCGNRAYSIAIAQQSSLSMGGGKSVPSFHRTVLSTRQKTLVLSQHDKQQRWNSTDDVFATEFEYHSVADETLEAIQDAVEIAIEDECDLMDDEPEVTFASGVLTLSLPPHGTWVLNKQTPNQQIWWSSPISGPRRYEYDGKNWVYTRAGEGVATGSNDDTLKGAMRAEFEQIYGVELQV